MCQETTGHCGSAEVRYPHCARVSSPRRPGQWPMCPRGRVGRERGGDKYFLLLTLLRTGSSVQQVSALNGLLKKRLKQNKIGKKRPMVSHWPDWPALWPVWCCKINQRGQVDMFITTVMCTLDQRPASTSTHQHFQPKTRMNIASEWVWRTVTRRCELWSRRVTVLC